ncbi:glycoside hydrolase family 71/99-like protein [Tenacibaculum salmonis]|uniref:glycoside hydrolase family 71/99-like protein n=1 Tax=Tenacibaculum sp. P3-BQ1 TaxID=3232310 RepID=UPI0034DF45D1
MKNVLCFFVIITIISCSENNIEEIHVKELTELEEVEKLYDSWINGAENYDLEDIVAQEKNKVQNKFFNTQVIEQQTGKGIYVHYMPWFESEETDGVWGQHWTMTNKNPNLIDSNGKREIASHYYPLIGPYSTNDKDLQQYHLLLIKLSGVDGVIFDWYGKRDVLDFESIKQNTESFIGELEKTTLSFAIMYEDRVIREQSRRLTDVQLNQAQEDIKYIEQKYMFNNNYIHINRAPLLMVFGPSYINDSYDWNLILNSLENNVNALTLWGASNILGEGNSSGEYAWIDKEHLQTLSGYYNNVIDYSQNIVGGISYPRFNDFYVEGGWKSPLEDSWTLTDNGLETFRESFDESLKHPIDFIQIATWNDFGEGTQIEPTLEFGFQHLELLQEYTETTFLKEDLRVPYYIYKLRKKHPNNKMVQFLMDIAYRNAMNNNILKAKRLVALTIFYFGDDF